MAERFLRTCPKHLTEIVFRPKAVRGGGVTDVPWCYTHDHVCDYWLVRDGVGDVWAAAVLTDMPELRPSYLPRFSVDALLEEFLERESLQREPAQPRVRHEARLEMTA